MSSSSSALLGGGTSASSACQSQWESLRKRSRLLETQLHKKLQEFAHVQTAIMNEGRAGGPGASRSNAKAQRADLELDSLRASASSPISASAASASTAAGSSIAAAASSGSSPLQQYESISTDLSELLRSLADVNDGLSRLLADHPDQLGTQSNQYVAQKSRQAWSDATGEFRRTKQNIQAALARNELMGGAGRGGRDGHSLRPRTEQLLREGHSLHQSLKLTDDALDSVIQARESLGNQRLTLMGVTGKLKSLSAKFPVIGQLMNRISCKHQRDMIVLASVIAVCMIFTFVYVMSKP